MILAVSHKDGQMVPFAETTEFQLYDIQPGRFEAQGILPAAGGMGGVLMALMSSGVNAVLTGALSPDTRAMLSDMGIPAFGAGELSCDDAVRRFLAGELTYTAPASCSGSCSGCSGNCSSCGG